MVMTKLRKVSFARPVGLLALAALLAAVATGAALAATGSTSGGRRSSRGHHSAWTTATARAARARARKHFSVLADSANASTASVGTPGSAPLPPGAVFAARSATAQLYAWQPSGSQQPPAKAQAGPDGQVCLVVATASSTTVGCSRSAAAESEGVVLTSEPSKLEPTPSVAGLVPNGVTSVLATESGAAPRTVSVTGNAFDVEGEKLEKVEYRLPSGVSHTITVRESGEGQEVTASPAVGAGEIK